VNGVGPKTVEILRSKGIESVEDLLYFCPTRYEDRRRIGTIGSAREGESATLFGKVVSSRESFYRASRKRLRTAVLDDGREPSP